MYVATSEACKLPIKLRRGAALYLELRLNRATILLIKASTDFWLLALEDYIISKSDHIPFFSCTWLITAIWSFRWNNERRCLHAMHCEKNWTGNGKKMYKTQRKHNGRNGRLKFCYVSKTNGSKVSKLFACHYCISIVYITMCCWFMITTHLWVFSLTEVWLENLEMLVVAHLCKVIDEGGGT